VIWQQTGDAAAKKTENIEKALTGTGT